jgi:hypothetical protein
MHPAIWSLHVAVFELARACGLDRFRVGTKTHPGGVLIELTLAMPSRSEPRAPLDLTRDPTPHDLRMAEQAR